VVVRCAARLNRRGCYRMSRCRSRAELGMSALSGTCPWHSIPGCSHVLVRAGGYGCPITQVD
jgi:hypothetical protein